MSLGNGVCDTWGGQNTTECNYDGGDCVDDFFLKYPDCTVQNKESIGNGVCENLEAQNVEECGYDGGDCLEFNVIYPDCTADNPSAVGDGMYVFEILIACLQFMNNDG